MKKMAIKDLPAYLEQISTLQGPMYREARRLANKALQFPALAEKCIAALPPLPKKTTNKGK